MGRSRDPDNRGQCCNHVTGCGFGYACAVDAESGEDYCKLQPYAPTDFTHDVPRYHLLPVSNPAIIQQLYGFPVGEFQLAYYCNMENIITDDPETLNRHAKVENVVVVVHGSGYEADDYLLAVQSSIPETVDSSTVLIVAPYFVRPEDENVTTNDESREILRWADKVPEQSMQHSFRYGADAVNAPISSYATMDSLLQYLAKAEVQFPNLKRVVVTGHSAGGQFVQRWALLSSSPVWDGTVGSFVMERRPIPSRSLDIRVVVANPRSYCYLDARRWIDGNFTLPSKRQILDCPNYNAWEWGLDDGGAILCPYRDLALNQISRGGMANRYVKRDVVYLAGEFDKETQVDGCESADFQGPNRLERSYRFFTSLREMFGEDFHQWFQVKKSPHDHWLMYQSESARTAIFNELQ